MAKKAKRTSPPPPTEPPKQGRRVVAAISALSFVAGSVFNSVWGDLYASQLAASYDSIKFDGTAGHGDLSKETTMLVTLKVDFRNRGLKRGVIDRCEPRPSGVLRNPKVEQSYIDQKPIWPFMKGRAVLTFRVTTVPPHGDNQLFAITCFNKNGSEALAYNFMIKPKSITTPDGQTVKWEMGPAPSREEILTGIPSPPPR